ncbi:MAG: undecaprenyldiphospho-muramoylpentapeptide beta-N-acetylglucosaminyltransferase [Cyanophyceae cyanobacterium]
MRLLIAASGTGGHLFPALALAQQLDDSIEWLGVPDRLEQTLVPECYPLHTVPVEGLQTRLSFGALPVFWRFLTSIFKVRQLLKDRKIDAVLTTGGYIAGPAILAARLERIPVVLHESNFIPGKMTRLFGSLCSAIALGFAGTAQYLKNSHTVWVGTPVRSQFLSQSSLELPVPTEVPLIVVVGGSQGALAVNQLVRQCAPAWFAAGAWVVHLTGENDPEAKSLQHRQYLSMPFYHQMAGLLQRADLAISRAGAGTLTELAVTQTPAILIPYPFAAEDHQAYNAQVFADAGAALMYRQEQLTPELLTRKVLELLPAQDTPGDAPHQLQTMAQKAASLAVTDSAQQLATLVRQTVEQG